MPKALAAVSHRLAAQGATQVDSPLMLDSSPSRTAHQRTEQPRNNHHADLGSPSRTRMRRSRGKGATALAVDDSASAADLDRAMETLLCEFKVSGCEETKQRLIAHYMRSLVRRVAERLTVTLPGLIDVEDLCQVGYLGLVKAISNFDPGRHVKFETFAAKRISGSMRDYLREIDPVPRLKRTRSKKVAAAEDRFTTANGRQPTREELRHLMQHVSDQEFEKMLEDRSPAAMVSFSAAAAEVGEIADECDAMCGFEDRRHSTPLTRAERHDLCLWLTRGLCDRDRLIVMLYYYEEMTMKEIGETLGCSESRVSQRLESVIQRLKSRLGCASSAEQEFWF